MIITESEKRTLLHLARTQIKKQLIPGKVRVKDTPEKTGNLSATCGAFVSLYVKGKLRGCMGTFSESEKLYKNVERMAVAAAISDSRFEPLNSRELENLDIEISVLTPMKRITQPEEIVLGKHGIYIEKDGRRGTFLPQVATAQNWDVDEFLGHCSKYKAGLGWDEWKKAKIYVYEALIFRSDENN
jgi:hypothetical protein